MTFGIALVGSGIFAKEEHLPAIQNTPTLSLRAIYSRSLRSAKSLSKNLTDVDIYSDDSEGRTFDDLLRRPDIVGVIIALPIVAQPEYIKKALAAGKHVIAEKPIAKDVATAEELLAWTSELSNTRATYSVAENFRFMDSFIYASEVLQSLGRILTFRARVAVLVQPGTKYFETSWRKTPEYQGGFLLDGGIHTVAALRMMVQGAGSRVQSVSAYTVQLQQHLPPIDTLNAVLLLDNGSSGTLSISFGTTDSGVEYVIAAEQGTVKVSKSKVTVTKDGKDDVKEFSGEGSGVKQEVRAWAASLETGQRNPMQSPEEALLDLKLLEACLQSGRGGGKAIVLEQN